MGEINSRLSQHPYTMYNGFRCSSGLYAEYIDRILNLVKIPGSMLTIVISDFRTDFKLFILVKMCDIQMKFEYVMMF